MTSIGRAHRSASLSECRAARLLGTSSAITRIDSVMMIVARTAPRFSPQKETAIMVPVVDHGCLEQVYHQQNRCQELLGFLNDAGGSLGCTMSAADEMLKTEFLSPDKGSIGAAEKCSQQQADNEYQKMHNSLVVYVHRPSRSAGMLPEFNS